MNRAAYSLLIVRVGFCADLRCHAKVAAETEKYAALLQLLRERWGRVDFVCVLAGHASTTLEATAEALSQARSKPRPTRTTPRPGHWNDDKQPDPQTHHHDMRLLLALLDQLSHMATMRLEHIFVNIAQQLLQNSATPNMTSGSRPAKHICITRTRDKAIDRTGRRPPPPAPPAATRSADRHVP